MKNKAQKATDVSRLNGEGMMQPIADTIKAGKYEEAYAMLQGIDNRTANRWREKIERILEDEKNNDPFGKEQKGVIPVKPFIRSVLNFVVAAVVTAIPFWWLSTIPDLNAPVIWFPLGVFLLVLYLVHSLSKKME